MRLTSRRGTGRPGGNAVTAGAPRVHVHLPIHLHMNKAMIRIS